jgi:transitional endoplasmic reticulum ATPase
MKGDIIVLGGVQRRRDLMSEEFGMEDVFGNLNDIFGGFGNLGGIQQIRFIVASTNPNIPCIITENTEVVLSNKTIEISDEKIPEVNYEDIGGLTEEVRKIREMVELPLKRPEIFERLGVEPPKGVLVHGPPGTGKTLLAKAVANESEANFIQVKGPSLLSMWVGKSEEGIRKIFNRARQVSPCIVFFDEIDSLAGKRGLETGTKVTERVLNQLLAEMDGIEDLSNVVVIAATNRPDMLDSALLRPGRFDRILLVGSPEKEGREKIFGIHTKNMPIKLTKEEISQLDNKYKNTEIIKEQNGLKKASKFIELSERDKLIHHLSEQTEGYVGADIESLVREAAMLALREDIESKEINMKYFEEAMKKVGASVTRLDMDRYRKIETEYLRSAKSALEMTKSYLG